MNATPSSPGSGSGNLAVQVVRSCGGVLLAIWKWILRWGLMLLGILIVMIGLLLGPLPGPGGIPIVAVGLVLILRGSLTARKRFVRLHRRYPRFLGPVRRILRWRWRRSPQTPS